MMFWYGNMMNGWAYGAMAVAMVLFWGVVILGVIALIRHLGRANRSVAEARPAAEHLLAERFARGDIDEQEYLERLDVLREGTGTNRVA
jgi:putative membrane protein